MARKYSNNFDYNQCDVCGLDHDYQFSESLKIHKQIVYLTERNKVMSNLANEKFELTFDPRAYVSAGMITCLMLMLVSAALYPYFQ